MRIKDITEGQVVQFPTSKPVAERPIPHPLGLPPAVGDYNSSDEWQGEYDKWKHYRKLLRTKYGNPEFERMVQSYADWVAKGSPKIS